jgi:hypothetical protein
MKCSFGTSNVMTKHCFSGVLDDRTVIV